MPSRCSPAATRGLIAIFLDEYHVQAGENTLRARAALAKFVDTELRPSDQVAIMKPLDPLNTIQTLTIVDDRAKLQAQIEAFAGRKGDYTPTTAFEQNFMSRASAPADASRTQIVSSALQALAMRIGAIRDGRKTLVLVSEGFSPTLPRGSDRLMGSLRAIVYAANRYDVAIYPIDPSAGATGSASETDAATLKMLADQTGGEAAFNQADLMPALKQAVADEDEYYVVTYRAASSGDGKFHPVQMRVKRADAQIRVRSGYWSANPELLTLAAGMATPPASAMPIRPPHSSALIRPWVGTARGPDGLTNVTVAWDPGLAPPRNQRVGSVELKGHHRRWEGDLRRAADAARHVRRRAGDRASRNDDPGHRRQDAGLGLSRHPGAEPARHAPDVCQPRGDAHAHRAPIHRTPAPTRRPTRRRPGSSAARSGSCCACRSTRPPVPCQRSPPRCSTVWARPCAP